MDRLRFGIIGVGGRGMCNARAVAAREDVEIVGLCDINPDRLAECEQAGLPGERLTDYRELLDRGLDAVCINTDNDVHAEITIAAAQAGCHVYCEKPIALTVADAEAMTRACQDAGVATLVNLSLRAYPEMIALRQMVQEGALGKLLAVGAAHPKVSGLLCHGQGHKATQDPAKWGTLLLHDGVHICEWLRFIGGEVQTAFAHTITTGDDPDNEELVSAITTHEGGVMGTLSYFTMPFIDRKLYAIGTDATAWPEPDADGPCVLLWRDGQTERVPVKRPPLGGDDFYVDEFIRAIREGHHPFGTMEDGLAGQRIVDAIKRSAREGRVITV
jgi:predicted dehydrogenase